MLIYPKSIFLAKVDTLVYTKTNFSLFLDVNLEYTIQTLCDVTILFARYASYNSF